MHTATHCNALQHTAAHCITLPHTATHCNVCIRSPPLCLLTHAHCNPPKRTATHGNTLQHKYMLCRAMFFGIATKCTAIHSSTLQHTATHCNTYIRTLLLCLPPHTHCNLPQHTATHCNAYLLSPATFPATHTLQHTATHCNTLQHTASQARRACRERQQDTATHTLWQDATHTLQHTATEAARYSLPPTSAFSRILGLLCAKEPYLCMALLQKRPENLGTVFV